MSNLNHTFRIIWNHSLQVWQAVAETASGQGKSKSAKSALTPSRGAAVALAGALTLGLAYAGDLPLGGQVVGGQASVQTTGAVMTVRQDTANLAIDWQSFNIGKGNTVNFVQPTAQATALNRVLGSDVSLIQGALNANGKLFLVNPNGIVFTPTAQVNVGGLVASTLNLSPTDFMAGNYRFEGDSAAAVTNQGQIRVANGGAVALIAAQIVNTGDITAPGGSIAMGAGRKVRLAMGGATLLEVEEGALNALIEQGGALRANDGRIYLSARAARDLVSSVINQSGLIEANSISGLGGLVTLEADTIALTAGSRITATGALGGGQVLVGGDWQGSGTLRQASHVSMATGASIDASATQQGDGGKVVLWSDIWRSDSVTTVNGSILAKGAGVGGNGGQVETSGHLLEINEAFVSTKSAHGRTGDWLLDPGSITITSSGTVNSLGSTAYEANGTTTITPAAIAAALDNNNVTIQTGAGDYDLTVSSPIAYIGDTSSTLTLDAGRDLFLGANISNKGGISLLANRNIRSTSNLTLTTGGGDILLASNTDNSGGGNISAVLGFTAISNGGNITLGGGDTRGSGYALGGLVGPDPYMGIRFGDAAILNSDGGNISIKGKSHTTSTNVWAAWGVGFDKTVNINSGTGTIYIEGVSQNTTVGGYAAGVSLSGVIGTNSLAMNITSANDTANAIKIIGDNQLVTAGNDVWGLVFRSSATSITATEAGGGITLNGANPSGWDAGFYVAGGNILATSGDIRIGALNTGGRINTGGTTYFGANSAIAGNTSSTSNILFVGDRASWTTPNINTTGTFTFQPFSPGFAVDVYRSWFAFNAANTVTSNKLSGFALGKDGSADMGIYTTSLNTALDVNGPINLYGGHVTVGANLTSSGSDASILAKASGRVTVEGVTVQTNGGDITLNSNSAGAATGGIYVLNNSVLDSRTSADRTAGSNTTGGGAITLGGGVNPLTGYAQNVSTTAAGVLLGTWRDSGQNANIDLNSGGGNITVNGKSTQQYGNLSVGVHAWEGVNMDAGTTGDITINGLATGGAYSWGMDIQAWRNGSAPSTYQTGNGNITINGTGTGGTIDGGISLLAASSATALTLKATGTGSITLNGLSDNGTEGELRLGYANLLAQSGAITLNGNRAGSMLTALSSRTTTLGYLAGSGIETSSSDITLNVDKLNIVGSFNINTSGTLTVQPYSTSFSSALTWPATNVTVSSGLTGLTLGKLGNTADITVSSAQTIAGPINIYGGNINLSANLASTLSGAAILAKASGNIVQAANVAVTTNNGAVTFWADSDNSGQGYIALNAGSSVGTTGGKIVMAGGLDDGGTHAGLTGLIANDGTPDGYAKTATDSIATENAVDAAGVSVGLAGNTGSSVNLLSGGGDIVIRGQGGARAGVISQNTFKIDSGTGRVDMQGKSTSAYGIGFGWLGTPNWAISSANTTEDAITLTGQGGLLLGNVSSGNMLIQATGAGGGINLSGVNTGTGAYWGTFISLAGATTQILAQSGPINITGFKSGAANDFYSGGTLYLGNRKDATAINGVTPLVTGSSANFTFNVDSFNLANSTTYLSSTGTLKVQPYSTSFDSAQTWGVTPTSTFTELQLGKLGNTSDITIGSATSIAGPINIFGGNIAINAALTATGTNIISLTASGTVTDGDGYVVADKLALLGGNVMLDNASNSVGTLAASGVSGLTYVDSNALTISSVGGTAGITATGPISVSTQVDNLTISQNISTTNATSSAIVLNAGASAAAGTAAGGNIVITGDPALMVGDGGRATLYTGSISGSTGLAGLIESGHARYNADESNTTGFTTALADGSFAIYREQPLVSLRVDAQTSTYGDELPTLTGTLTGSTFNGDEEGYSLVGVTNSSSGKAKVGTYNIVESGLTGLGYGVNVTQVGSLTVSPKVLTASGMTIADKVYDGLTLAVLSQNSTVSPIDGDQVSLTTTANFTTKNVGLNKSVNVSYVISGDDGGNYAATSQTNVATTAKISAKALTVSGLSSAHKVYDGTTQAQVLGTTSVVSQAAGSGAADDGKAYVGDVIELTGTPVANFASSNVGQSIVVSFTGLALAGAQAGNYTLTPHATTQKNITPRTVTLSGTKTYDGTTSLTSAVTLGNLVVGESLNYVGATASNAHVASAAKYISAIALGNGSGLASNYQLPVLNATNAPVVISAATLTPTLANTQVSKVYDGSTTTPQEFVPTYSFGGLVAGDSSAALAYSLARYDDQDVAQASTITVSGLSITSIAGSRQSLVSDYVLDATSKTVAAGITARPVSGRLINTPTKTYDGSTTAALANSNYSLANLVSGESFTVTKAFGSYNSKDVLGASSVSTALGANDFVGVAGTSASNYVLPSSVSGAGSILARNITVTADNKTKTFGDGDPAFTYKVTTGEVVTGDSLGGLLVRAPGSVAGAYAIDPTGLNNTNYSFSYVDGLLTIAPAPMAVSNGMNALAAPALPATPSMLVASLPLLDRSVGLVLIPLSPAQLEKAIASNAQDSGGAEAPGQLMKTASSMGFTGLLVVDGGVSLPADAGLQQGK